MSRFAILLLLLSSCSFQRATEPDTVIKIFDKLPQPVKLAPTNLPWQQNGLPTRITLIDPYLFIVDLKNRDAMVAVWDIEKQVEIRKLIPNGEGPFELSAVSSIFPDGNGNIYFYDLQNLRMLEARLDCLVMNKNYLPRFKKRLLSTDFEHANRIQRVNDSTFVAITLPALNGRFRFLNRHLDYVGAPFGEFPYLDRTAETSAMTDISFGAKVLGNLYAATLAVNEPSATLLVAHNNVDVLDLFNLQTKKLLLRVVGPDQNYPPRYRLNSQGQALPCQTCNAGYKSPQALTDWFLAIRLHKRYSDFDAYESRFIFVFAWSGDLHKILELDSDITDFVVDEKRKTIFTLSLDSDYPLQAYHWH